EKVFPLERRLVAAARPFARTLLDVPLPPDRVFEDVERLVGNLVAMNGILRDRAGTSIRLVMNPDRMVIREAMRTYTYLNLYGYLTDAVVVNRVFPEEVDGGYFEGWRAHQQEQMELVRSAFSPVPILTAPFFEQEVVGAAMLDRLADAVFADGDPEALMYEDLSQELQSTNGTATLRVPLPFVEKADIELKKIGLEVVVRVGGQKRTIILPSALSAYRPRSEQFEGGSWNVLFEKVEDGRAADWPRTAARAPASLGGLAARRATGRRRAQRARLPGRPRRARPVPADRDRRGAAAGCASGAPGAVRRASARAAAHPARGDRLVPGAARQAGARAPGGGHPDRVGRLAPADVDRADGVLVGQLVEHLVDDPVDVGLVVPEAVEESVQRRVRDLQLRRSELE